MKPYFYPMFQEHRQDAKKRLTRQQDKGEKTKNNTDIGQKLAQTAIKNQKGQAPNEASLFKSESNATDVIQSIIERAANEPYWLKSVLAKPLNVKAWSNQQ